MKTVAIVSAKGGVGKSTISANIAMALFRAGNPVLGVDLDPQNALRFHLGDHSQRLDGVARATLEARNWRHVAFQVSGGLAMLPYGVVNEHDRRIFERHLASDPHWLRRNLEGLPMSSDTVVVIDTPPGPSVYLHQALAAANLVLVVTLADAASYATLPQIENLVRQDCKPRADFIDHAFLVNQFDASKPLCNDVVHAMRKDRPGNVIGLVRFDYTVGEALAQGQSIIDYDPASPARQDILAWTDWVTRTLASRPAAT